MLRCAQHDVKGAAGQEEGRQRVPRVWYVYVMASPWSHVLYIGVTGDLVRRVHQHKECRGAGFRAPGPGTAAVQGASAER